METRNNKRRLVRLGGAGALAVGLALGGFGVASAATGTPSTSGTGGTPAYGGPGGGFGHGGPGGPGGGPGGPGFGGPGPGRGLAGTVSALGTNSFTLQRPDGSTQTVDTTSSTTYQRDGQTSSASALAVGEHVSVRPSGPGGPPSASSSTTPVTAAGVDIQDPALQGTVQAVNGNVVTIVDEQGFWRTVNLSSSTTYTNAGQSATQTAVVQGAKVIAFGSIDADHVSLDATSVVVNPTRPTPPSGAGSHSGSTNTSGPQA